MTKTIAISGLTALVCLMGTLGTAQAQQQAQPREYSFPSQPGSYSPPSTLRITEQPAAGAAPSGTVRDTPESLAEFTRCRNNADRESIGNAELQQRIATCMQQLEARRRQ